jgi:tetratricopeptide (TPR) repeat protein
MRVVVVRIPLVMAACLVVLAGCATAPPLGEMSANTSADAYAAAAPGNTPAALPTMTPGDAAPGLLGSDANDHLSRGKVQFRASNYGLAEQHFRKAVELHPKDAEAWVGLAASNDRLHRFDLADRAYKEARRIIGPTPELLNNLGYSYMLRGDYTRARQTLRQAQARDPRNPYIRNNLSLLEKVARKGKGLE